MLGFVRVDGKDAEQFLHRVSAGAVRGTAVGEGRPGLLLSGQSRCIAQFDLLRLAPDAFALAAPAECAPWLLEELERLHFSEALSIRVEERRAACVEAPGARADRFPLREEGGELCWPSLAPGFSFSTRSCEPPGEAFHFARIGAARPWPLLDWDRETPALEAGMLPWIDRGKGCYPGQEVVELSLNVGHPARLLLAVEGEIPRDALSIPWGDTQAQLCSRSWVGGVGRALLRVPWKVRERIPAGLRRLPSS